MMRRLRFVSGWIVLGILWIVPLELVAQLSGISYRLSPSIDYYFSRKNAGLTAGPAAGVQLGFGFGEYIGLTASWQRSIGLKTDLNQLTDHSFHIADRDARLERLGGELQANFSRRRLIPFVTLGTGIQNVLAESTEKSRQIYLSSGAGLTYRLHDRIHTGVQLVHTSYRINGINVFLSPEERQDIPSSVIPDSRDHAIDWSVRAKLSLLMGGERHGEFSEVDRALREQFGRGLKGISLQLEPTVTYINFNSNLPFHNAYYAGLSAGFDFGPFIGIRAYYLHAFDESSFNSFEKSSVWGGETNFKLNQAQGIVPYISLGGGRINSLEGYIPPEGRMAENMAFASGGIGLEMPLFRRLKVMAFAKSLITTDQDRADKSQPEDLVISYLFGAKIGFSLGKKAESTETLFKDRYSFLEGEYAEKKSDELNKVVSNYESLLQEREARIAEREHLIDSLRSVTLKEKTEDIFLPESESITEKGQSIIHITPVELVEILREFTALAEVSLMHKSTTMMKEATAKDQVDEKTEKTVKTDSIDIGSGIKMAEPGEEEQIVAGDTVWIQQMTDVTVYGYDKVPERLVELEQAVASLERNIDLFDASINGQVTKVESLVAEMNGQLKRADALIDGLDRMIKAKRQESVNQDRVMQELTGTKREIGTLSERVRQLGEEWKTFNQKEKEMTSVVIPVSAPDTIYKYTHQPLRYSNMSVFLGPNFGRIFSVNMGLRWKYPIKETHFNVVPETYIGFGRRANLGFFVNTLYDIHLTNVELKPYIGLGAGFFTAYDNKNTDAFRGGLNIVTGFAIPQIAKGFYLDFTTRNFFRYNQVSAGFDLPF